MTSDRLDRLGVRSQLGLPQQASRLQKVTVGEAGTGPSESQLRTKYILLGSWNLWLGGPAARENPSFWEQKSTWPSAFPLEPLVGGA